MLSSEPVTWARDFSSLSRAASRLKACSGTKRTMKGTSRPAKIHTKPNVQRQELSLDKNDKGDTVCR